MAYIEVPLEAGGTMMVQVSDEEGVGPVARQRDLLGRIPETFGKSLDRVQAFTGEILHHMRDTPDPPDTVSIEFGLNLSVKFGVAVAESTGVAHIKVSAEWRKPDPTTPSPAA
jgi:hypothetical protein